MIAEHLLTPGWQCEVRLVGYELHHITGHAWGLSLRVAATLPDDYSWARLIAGYPNANVSWPCVRINRDGDVDTYVSTVTEGHRLIVTRDALDEELGRC
jgi:hypothetical protein